MAMMSRKHYNLFASDISDWLRILDNESRNPMPRISKSFTAGSVSGVSFIISNLIDLLKKENPGFKRDRFIQAIDKKITDEKSEFGVGCGPNLYWGRIQSNLKVGL